MKSLMITPYVTINSRPEFSRNKTGFGYMVLDIARAVGKLEKVELLATDSRGESFEYEGVHFLQRSYGLFLSCLFCCLSPFVVLQLWKQYRMKSGTFLRTVYYWLLTGYLRKLLNGRQYDVVHIHGCGFGTELWMQVCKNCNQKYVVTLHGLNSFSDTVKLEMAGKQYERNFLSRVVGGEFPITVISTGMKRLIENTYNTKECPNITVVCNSFNLEEGARCSKSIKEEYGIPQSGKMLLYVGNISENKNQRQMVEAYELLPEDLREKTWVLFCGRPSLDGAFERMVKAKPYNSHIVLCGCVDKESMSDYYKEADGVVLLSFSEGFGLSLVEGMHFGVPCAMFSDMDAFEDIYDEHAVVELNTRDTQTVSTQITFLLTKDWDRNAIREYANKFSSETMANHYLIVYKNILQ